MIDTRPEMDLSEDEANDEAARIAGGPNAKPAITFDGSAGVWELWRYGPGLGWAGCYDTQADAREALRTVE
jgi:hypothetical protein